MNVTAVDSSPLPRTTANADSNKPHQQTRPTSQGDTVSLSEEGTRQAQSMEQAVRDQAAKATTSSGSEAGPSRGEMWQAWGSTTRDDGARITVGRGWGELNGFKQECILVRVEESDAEPRYMALEAGRAYRLTRREDGGYDVSTDLEGGQGDELFIGEDLSGLNINGGDGDNTVMAARADGLTYTGGRDTDKVFVRQMSNSNIATGDGHDTIEAGTIKDSDISTGDGHDSINAGDWSGGVLDTGDGNDSLKFRSFKDGEVRTGDGHDSIEGYQIINAKVDTGDGNDGLDLYEIVDSDVNTGDGNDRLDMYEIQHSTVDTGKGNDSFDLYAVESSTVNTGDGDDSLNLYEIIGGSNVNTGAGDDSLDLYEIEDSTVDTGPGQAAQGDKSPGEGRGEGRDGFETPAVNDNDRISVGHIINSAISMGPGDDRLEAYEILDSLIDMDRAGDDDQGAEEAEARGGNDMIIASHVENSRITMGAGNDLFMAGALLKSELFTGVDQTNQDDQDGVFLRNAKDSIIRTGADRDAIYTAWATRLNLDTGAGDDTLLLDHAKDSHLTTGQGDDSIRLGSGQNVGLLAGEGEDTLAVNDPESVQKTVQGPDQVSGVTADDSLEFVVERDAKDTEQTAEALDKPEPSVWGGWPGWPGGWQGGRIQPPPYPSVYEPAYNDGAKRGSQWDGPLHRPWDDGA